MKKKQVKVILISLAVVLVLGGAYALYAVLSSQYGGGTASSQQEKEYQDAPDFTVYDDSDVVFIFITCPG